MKIKSRKWGQKKWRRKHPERRRRESFLPRIRPENTDGEGKG